MSLTTPNPPAAIIAAIDERRSSQEDARIQPTAAKESNFNLDDFNIASVSMPVYFLFFLLSYSCLFDFCSILFTCLVYVPNEESLFLKCMWNVKLFLIMSYSRVESGILELNFHMWALQSSSNMSCMRSLSYIESCT